MRLCKSFNCDVGCKGVSPPHQEFSYSQGVTKESFYKIDDLGENGGKWGKDTHISFPKVCAQILRMEEHDILHLWV